MDPSLSRRLDRVMRAYDRKTLVSELKFGVTDHAGNHSYSWQSPGSPDQHFIASSTKMMAAVIVQQLHEEHLLSLSDPLAHYLPMSDLVGLNTFGGHDYAERLTVRDILAHTSGIADYFEAKRFPPRGDISTLSAADPGWSYAEALTIARAIPSSFAPHSDRAHYSSTNYQLVGRLISTVTGLSFSEAVTQRICDPLGLNDTFVFSFENLAEFTRVSPLLSATSAYRGARRLASLGAEGSAVSTISDMMTFINATFAGTILSPAGVQELAQHQLPIFPRVTYGAGMMGLHLPRLLTGMPKGTVFLGHAGATGHIMFHDPRSKISIVATINQLAPSRLPYNLMMAALRIVNSR